MRVKRGTVSRRRHNKIKKLAKGFLGRRKNCFRQAKDAVEKGLAHAFAGRKQRKRQLRNLWIIRINAAAREHGISYSKLICGLTKAGIQIDRKVLADLALNNPDAFTEIVGKVKLAA